MVGGMEINPGTAEHPHRQIAAQLRAQIRRGDWGPGEKLPSIPAIAQMYGVAKQTVQRTIDALRIEGLLITKPGSGTYVRVPGASSTGSPGAGTAASVATTPTSPPGTGSS